MEFRVLGPLSIQKKSGESIRTSGKPRQLLALLLLNESHRVSASSLIAELWDDTPPPSAQTALQTHIFYLRKEFARKLGVAQSVVARDLLQTRDGGYQINVRETFFDLPEFHRLRATAQAMSRTGDASGASRELGRALDLWRGPALLDVDQGRMLRAAVAELDASRLETLVLFFDTQLRMGRHRETLSELARLVVHHPHHEELHTQFMIALCRSGYRARALKVFDELSRNMRDDLGMEPSPRISGLRHAIHGTGTATMDDMPGPAALPPPRTSAAPPPSRTAASAVRPLRGRAWAPPMP